MASAMCIINAWKAQMQKTLYLDAIEIPNVPAVEDGQKAPLKFLSQD